MNLCLMYHVTIGFSNISGESSNYFLLSDTMTDTHELSNIEKSPRRLIKSPILWLLVAGTIVVLMVMVAISGSIGDDNRSLEIELTRIQSTLLASQLSQQERATLEAELARLQEQADDIAPVGSDLMSKNVDWGAVMQAIGDYDVTRMTIDTIGQTDDRLHVAGVVDDEDTFNNFLTQLRETNLFQQVKGEVSTAATSAGEKIVFSFEIIMKGQ
jgi:Tfp pilus assembly protein PilN